MVHRDDGVVAGLGDVLQAGDFEPVEGAEDDREQIVQPARRHAAGDEHGDDQIGDADEDEEQRHAQAERLQHAEDDGAHHHEGGVEHIDRGDDAGAMIGTGPGLQRREGRDDEQAAGDGEAGEIDGDMDRA